MDNLIITMTQTEKECSTNIKTEPPSMLHHRTVQYTHELCAVLSSAYIS